MMRRTTASAMIAALALLAGCKDSGTNPPASPPPANPPVVQSVIPSHAAVGDTVVITGVNFGGSMGTSSVTIGGRGVTNVLGWTDAEISAIVPLLAATDSVRVTVAGRTSNAVAFTATAISYAETLDPVFQSRCVSCHGGTNNLYVDTYAHLMAGNSTNGPVVTAGNGEGSYLIRMLRGTVSGKPRMPRGGPYLADPLIDKFSTWIQQGAQNN